MTAGDEGLQRGFTGTRGAPFHAYPTPEKEAQRRELQNTEIKPSAQHQGAATRPARSHRLRDVGKRPRTWHSEQPQNLVPPPHGDTRHQPCFAAAPSSEGKLPRVTLVEGSVLFYPRDAVPARAAPFWPFPSP